MATLTQEVALLTTASTALTTEVQGQKLALATSVTDAAASQSSASISEANAAASASSAATSSTNAATSEANAAAVVTGGTASLTPAAGLIPLADANGEIANWMQKGLFGNIMSPLVHIPFKRQNDEVALSGAQTFTRASTATYTDPLDGLLKTAAIDTPRFERMADGGTGILLEGASTNLLTYSEQFNNAAWPAQGTANISAANSGVGADGTLTADTLNAAIDMTTNRIYRTLLGLTPSTTYTATLFVRSKGATTCAIGLMDASTGIFPNNTVALSGALQRVAVSLTLGPATTIASLVIGGADGDIEIWGAQVEKLPFASSYIPTTTTAVTRAADSSIALSPSGNFTRGDFSIVVDAEIKAGATGGMARLFGITGAGNNRLRTTTGIAGYDIRFLSGNGYIVDLSNADFGTPHRYAVTYVAATKTLSLFVDGVPRGTHKTLVLANVTDFGGTTALDVAGFNNTATREVKINDFKLYDSALSPSEVASA